MKKYRLSVVVDGNFRHSTERVTEKSKLVDEVLRDYMIEIVKDHSLDTPNTATFEFEIRRVE